MVRCHCVGVYRELRPGSSVRLDCEYEEVAHLVSKDIEIRVARKATKRKAPKRKEKR